MVDDDEGIAFEPNQAVIGERAEELVHALAGRPDHRREVALGERRVETDRAAVARSTLGLGKPREARGEAARDVEEVELLDVRRQAPQLARERREQCVPQGRLTDDELAETAPRQAMTERRCSASGSDRNAQRTRAASGAAV